MNVSPLLRLAVILQAVGLLVFLIPKTYKTSVDLKEYNLQLEKLQEALDINTEEEEEEEMGPTTFLGKLKAVFTIKNKPIDKKKTLMTTDLTVNVTLTTICIVVIVLVSLSGTTAL